MVHMKKLNILGYQGKKVSNVFFEQETDQHKAALLYPGWGYTVEMPAMFYTSSLLAEQGYDVLQVAYTYNRNEDYLALSQAEQHQWFFADIEAAFEKMRSFRKNPELVLVGKSMGTLALSHLLDKYTLPENTKLVWLTPLIANENMRRNIAEFKGKSLIVIGTADQHYHAEGLQEVQDLPQVEIFEIENADHGLQFEKDTLSSLMLMEKILTRVKKFVEIQG